MVAERRRELPTGQVVFGAFVVLLLLDTTGRYPTGRLLTYVLTLFVLVGVWALVRSGLRSLAGPALPSSSPTPGSSPPPRRCRGHRAP